MRLQKMLVFLLILAVFLAALTRLDAGAGAQGRRQLEEALRRTAVGCYASEGAYPPSVQYMEEKYGLQYDREKFTVRYEIFASNLMPDITVLEVAP